MNTDKIHLPGLLAEIQAAAEDYDKKYFRNKVMRIYAECLKSNRILLATKIAEKYRKELTETLRSDLSIAEMYSIFATNISKTEDK